LLFRFELTNNIQDFGAAQVCWKHGAPAPVGFSKSVWRTRNPWWHRASLHFEDQVDGTL